MPHLETCNISDTTQRKLSDFFAKASRAAARALILDYDGTLAPFSADRQRAFPYPVVPALLERIRASSNTRVVIVTGRRAPDIATLLGLKNIEVWGCHGLSRLHPDGRYEPPNLDEKTVGIISEANKRLIEEGLFDLLELKPGAIAIHWRGTEEAANKVGRRVEKVWLRLDDRKGLELLKFDGGMEIRVAGRNKGDAVRTILAEMADHPAVAYLGDDQTDEDAFAALQGYGLSVLVRRSSRPTVADVWIQPPQGVTAFLSDWAAACGGAA
ncbi:MAG: trehalose-phosphatase [Terriglobales bacterium]